ncbi:hypothetical protein ACF8FG_20825 [Pseudomonas sp. YQ_6]|uniref:hypothetical protein n=1 Tax=unclassified Pseudomonas TaxID=196821 RepID=UPI00256244E4|nr:MULTISPECIES: hypothetical protein [unclassified Pseudomonas]EKT4493108.1 hypothetical protein [Pseudomonas putida]EKT8864096.1 hypothetical protein [Pseudomonas putida]
MFVSDSKAEIKGLAAILEPGQRAWHLVLKPQLSPWFHVTAVRYLEGFETRDVLFIDSLQALTAWMGSGQDDVGLESLQLVSPAWMNGRQCWEMDVLGEVAQDPLEGRVRFTLKDGRMLYYPDPQSSSGNTFSKIIYCQAPQS